MKVAFFDVDNTITSKDTFFKFALFLFFRFPWRIFRVYRVFFYYLITRVFGFDRILVKCEIIKILNGLDSHMVEQVIEEFVVKRVQPILHAKALQKIAQLKKEGYQIFLCSASLELYLSKLGEILQVGVIATKTKQMENGKFQLGAHCYQEGKWKRIEEYAQEKQLKFDFMESFFFSDHHSDIPMMNKVGHPIAVNPNRKLRKYASINKWEIVNW